MTCLECTHKECPLRDEVNPIAGCKDGLLVGEVDQVDWKSFRREAAKDILAGMVAHPRVVYGHAYVDEQVRLAIMYADELISRLKGE